MSERNYKPVGGGEATYIRPKALADSNFSGVVLEGIYEGTIANSFDNTKSDFRFTDLNGKTVIINSSGLLASKLSKVEEGSAVQIRYDGMTKITKGKMAGKSAHNWEVLVADED